MSPAIQYDFANGSTDSRRLLDAMATESIGKYEVGDDRVSTNDPILVKRVVLIVSCPCTLNLREHSGRK